MAAGELFWSFDPSSVLTQQRSRGYGGGPGDGRAPSQRRGRGMLPPPCCLVPLLWPPSGAALQSQAGDEGIVSDHIYGPLVGHRVILEGIAWDHGKGIAGRILLPSGDEVYITDPWQTAKDTRGKPIKDTMPS